MVFKALQDKFKVKSSMKYLEEALERPSTSTLQRKGISSVGCIVDMDKFTNAEVFYELRNDFSLKPNAIQIIGYKKDFDKNSPFAIQFFTDKDLGWKGTIENGYVAEFTDREYDVLINYYDSDNMMLKLLTVKTRARLKVGFGSVDHKLNDLILNTAMSNFESFRSELKKYLKVLKEI